MVSKDVLLLHDYSGIIPYNNTDASLVLMVPVTCHDISCNEEGAPLALDDVMGKAKMLSCVVCGLGGTGGARGEGALLAFRWVWVVFWRFGVCVEFSPVVGVAGALELLVVRGGVRQGTFRKGQLSNLLSLPGGAQLGLPCRN